MRAARLYVALLWCYPASFRQEYGAEMLGAFMDELHAARHEPARFATARVWLQTLADVVPTALEEHLHVLNQDLRHAFRLFAQTPVFTAVAVLSLALGLGANTAIFSLLDGVLLTTLPVRNPHELVMLTDPTVNGVSVGMEGGDRSLLTYQEFLDLQAGSVSFSAMMASQSSLQRSRARIDGAEPEEVGLRMVSVSYFRTLGIEPIVGRTFDAATDPAPGSLPQAVISHEYWQRRFGGRSDVVGHTMAFRNGVLSIVGVAPDSFFGETIGERPDAWVPLAMQAVLLPGRDWLHDAPGNVEKVMWLHAFGRLKPGVPSARAEADVNVRFRQGLTGYYASVGDLATRKRFMEQRLKVRDAATGASELRDSFAEPLLVLLSAAGLVLLIACANLGNMLLARTTARNRELSVRLALGASRGRVMRQLFTESVLLAVMGGLVGLAAGLVIRQGLLWLVSDTPIVLPPALDGRMLAFSFAITMVAGVVLGVLPALRLAKTEPGAGLREQGRGIAGSAAWLRVGRAVVVLQLALSLPLLVGAGLLVRTLMNLQRVDVGYAKDDVVTMRVDGASSGFDHDRRIAAFEALLVRIRALPGVRSATYSNNGLFGGSDNGDEIVVEGYTPSGDDDKGSRYDAVGPQYFSTLGIPVKIGREIGDQDRFGGRTVCVVNETFAHRFFKGRNPLGLHVTQVYAEERHTYEVVGVVADSRQRRLRGPVEHRFFVPATQPAAGLASATCIVRPRGATGTTLAEVRGLVERTEPGMTIARGGTVGEAIESRMVQDRLLARLSLAFGVVAALLVAMGLYGLLSYGVERRTNEIGVRKALGASHAALVGLILRETGWLVAVGLLAGVALSAAAIQLVSSRLYGLSSADPGSFAIAVAALCAIAALASWLPAARAARVDPLVALRYE
jgi:predicted permease